MNLTSDRKGNEDQAVPLDVLDDQVVNQVDQLLIAVRDETLDDPDVSHAAQIELLYPQED